jgi:DNA-binding transcriptional LysR family regulator
MRITARQIELFQMAYSLRSVRRAAEALSVSQPSVSRAVSEIETEIGVALFDRAGRRFEPTSAGHNLHHFVQQHYRGLDRIHEAAQRIKDGAGGHLRLAALHSVVDAIATRAAGRLMARYPDLRIDLEVLGEQDCLASIRAGQSDCAIISSIPRDANMAYRDIAGLTPVVIVHTSDDLARAARISLADLADKAMVMLPSQSPFRTILERAFDEVGVDLSVRSEARTQTALIELVGLGIGVAIVGRDSLEQSRNANVIAIPLSASFKWPIRLIAPTAEIASPTLEKLLSELRGLACHDS